MARVLLIIAPERFRDDEVFITSTVLQQAGNDVTLASAKTGRCHGSNGGSALVGLLLGDADADEYEAVALAGGPGAALLFEDEDVRWIVQRSNAAGRVVAAISNAPVILANAGILRGKNVTAAASEMALLKSAGALCVDSPVVVDGNIVTANGPRNSRLFGEAISNTLNSGVTKPARRKRAAVRIG